ncbi:MAG: metalloregulator ArsR/SmtB family transcription factor [Gemmatimonadetes bacterium]|nr:metalloregulator ArsR/SmtB family transcription factor [Gemmatimonadota bacterium]
MAADRLPIHDRLAALADATRGRILLALDQAELTVGELETALQLPQSTVSRHLRILADDGWLQSRAEGASRWYRMAGALDDGSAQLWAVVREAMGASTDARQLRARVEAVVAARRSPSQAFFASASAEWDALRDALFGSAALWQVALGLLNPAMVVGDLGCGTGALAEALAPHVARVEAVDASPAMLAAARTRLAPLDNVGLHDGTLEALPLADASLDAAVLLLVLHHVADPRAALREVARVVRPGGRVVVGDMVPHAHERYRAQMGHLWLGFGAAQVTAWLTDAGFGAVRVTALPVAPGATGPGVFVAGGVRGWPRVGG